MVDMGSGCVCVRISVVVRLLVFDLARVAEFGGWVEYRDALDC